MALIELPSPVIGYEDVHPTVTITDRAGRALLDLPVNKMRYEESLDAPGAADITYPETALHGVHLDPWNHVIVVADRDVGRWCGPVIGVVIRRSGEPSQIRAQGMRAYLDHRLVPDQTFTGAEQSSIAAYLIGLGVSGGYPFSTTLLSSDGNLRDRTYRYWERATAMQRLDELAEVEQGYKCRCIPVFAGGVWTWKWITIGWLAAPITIVHGGRGVQILDVTLDGSAQVTQATVTGEGQEDAQLAQTVTSTGAEVNYPRLEQVKARQGVTIAGTLTSYAQGIVDAHDAPSLAAVVSIAGESEYPTIGQIVTLDIAQLDRRVDTVLVGRVVSWEPGAPLVQTLQLAPLTEVERWRTL